MHADPNAPPAQRRPKKAKTDGENGETKRESGLQKPLRVSPELGDWLGGVTEASRAQLTSHFWKYVKANGLQVRLPSKVIAAPMLAFDLPRCTMHLKLLTLTYAWTCPDSCFVTYVLDFLELSYDAGA